MVLLTTTPAKAKGEAYDSTPTRLMGHLGIPITTVVSQRSQGSLHFRTQQAITKALFSPHWGGGNSEHQEARHLSGNKATCHRAGGEHPGAGIPSPAQQ